MPVFVKVKGVAAIIEGLNEEAFAELKRMAGEGKVIRIGMLVGGEIKVVDINDVTLHQPEEAA